MSFCNWLYRLAAGGILAATLCSLGSDVIAQGVEQNTSGQERPAIQRGEPSREVDPVAARAIQDEINRISRTIEAQKDEAEAKRKDDRDESALNAQWHSALWAKYSGWAAWVSAIAAGIALIVTGAGVILVWFTLRHTRDAAVAAQAMVIEAKATTKAAQESVEEARKATEFSRITADAARESLAITDRAWIEIEGKPTNPLIIENGTITVSASFTFRNIGRAPAVNVSTSITLHRDGVEAAKRASNLASLGFLASMAFGRRMGLGAAIFPGKCHTEGYNFVIPIAAFKERISERNEDAAKSKPPYSVTAIRPAFLVQAEYFLPGDKSRRFTYLTLEIHSIDRKHTGWDGADGYVERERLTLRPDTMGSFVK